MTQLRDKDHAVLHQIQEGNTDIQQITEATTLTNREVNYAFQKLATQDLIQIHKPDGMIERVVDGQKRVFQHPKQAQLTDKGQQSLTEDPPQAYKDMTHEQLVQKVRDLEDELQKLRTSVETLREQVRNQL